MDTSPKQTVDNNVDKSKGIFSKDCVICSATVSLIISGGALALYHFLYSAKQLKTLISKTDQTNALITRLQNSLVEHKALPTVVTKNERFSDSVFELDRARSNMATAVANNMRNQVINVDSAANRNKVTANRGADVAVVYKQE